MKLIVLPVTFYHGSISVGFCPFSVLFVVFPFPVVDVSNNLDVFPFSVPLIVLPFPIVDGSISEGQSAFSVLIVVLPFPVIDSSTRVGAFSFPVPHAVVELAEIFPAFALEEVFFFLEVCVFLDREDDLFSEADDSLRHPELVAGVPEGEGEHYLVVICRGELFQMVDVMASEVRLAAEGEAILCLVITLIPFLFNVKILVFGVLAAAIE